MGLKQDLLEQPVSELAIRELLTVRPTDTVRQAMSLMRAKRLGCVVVVDADGRPLGKFTEKRLAKLLLEDASALDQSIAPHMLSAWAVVTLTDPIAKVIDAMQAKAQRFVIVVDEDNKAIGLTGQKGIIEYIADHFPRSVKVQLLESKLFMDQREGA